MPKARNTRPYRPAAPYYLRTANAINPPIDMDDPYLTMSQHSPAPWNQPHYSQYPPPPIMTSGTDYSHAMLTPSLHQSAMPTPAMPSQQSARASHSRHHSQSAPWTAQEDDTLRRARQQGLGWSAIHEQYFPGKSANACRKRYERVMIKNRGADWDEPKLENLAAHYDALRSQIWRPLAEQVNERWETVEKICMQQGLKTLRNKASNHTRNRSTSGSSGHRISSEFERSSPNDDFNDSGIGLGVRRSGRRQSLQPSGNLGQILQNPDNSYYQ